MKKCFTTLAGSFLFICTLSWHWTCAQTVDSVRTELTTEPAATVPTDTSERAQQEKVRLKELFLRSRKEITIFQFGYSYPNYYQTSASDGQLRRPAGNNFLLGINHKIYPNIGLRGDVTWRPAWGSISGYRVNGAIWRASLAIDYYPFINKRLRTGKTANNFYANPYLTIETTRPLNNQTVTDDTNHQYLAVPFQQSMAFTAGVMSKRTLIYFYSISGGLAYWFGRADDVQHPLQPTVSFTYGLAF